uniref:Uncharacterized protein n=1 Tax=Nymphaea colorata TaxID=210225 RepID=A0A5K0XX29_9MAGN
MLDLGTETLMSSATGRLVYQKEKYLL